MRIASILVVLCLSGCATTSSTVPSNTSTAGDEATNKAIGAAAGALIGGLIGNQVGSGTGRTVATVVGGLIGAGIGVGIAQQLTEKDRQIASATTQNALNAPVGTSFNWTNPETGNSGTVVTVATSSSDCIMLEQRIDLADGQGEQLLPIRHCRNDAGAFAPA